MELDVFKQDAFKETQLTAAVNLLDYVPGTLGAMGLFEAKPISTLSVWIEEKNNTLTLVPNIPRGGNPDALDSTEFKRNARQLVTTHLPKTDTISADEIQSVRAFGESSALQTMQQIVQERQMYLRSDIELTWEHLMLGAVQGIIYDADGSTVIYNLFTEFNVSQESEVDFELDDATTSVRNKCAGIVRTMMRNLKGGWRPGMGIAGLASDGFWDALVAHSDVEQTFLNWQAAKELQDNTAFGSLNFGGIEWQNYRGTDDESTVSLTADKAIFFPVRARNLFQIPFSPADRMTFANTRGLPFYSFVDIDPKDRFVEVEVQSNPLPICNQPLVLMKGKKQ